MNADVTSLFARATAAHETGRWHDAERDYRAVLTLDPAHADALHQFGMLAYQNGNVAVAIELVRRAVSSAPERGSYQNTLGVALLDAGETPAALAAFERAMALGPVSIELRNNYASTLHAAGRIDEAIAIYRALLDEAPDDADLNSNFGRALEAAGILDEAVQRFRAARLARPQDAIILAHLSNALSAKGAFEEAAAVGEEASRLLPESAVVWANLGNALMGLRRFDEAISSYEKASAAAPHLAELHMNLGIACHAAGRLADAARCFEKVLGSNVDARARLALARTYVTLGQRDKAIPLFRAVLAANPADHEARLDFGLALNDLGRHAEGLEEIARGPGLAHLAVVPSRDGEGASRRRAPLTAASAPNFIGSWFLEDAGICDRLIDLFENSAARHRQGRTSRGLDLEIKNATDLVVFPNELAQSDFAPVAAYLRELEACIGDYARQWPHFGETLQQVDVVPFQIQRYRPGGHFQSPHSERMSFGLVHRVLAWMTYLNDVEDGGLTRFHHYGLDVRPERGRTLIWPAEWTHVHAGQVVKAGTKYIITGWMHFPHPAA